MVYPSMHLGRGGIEEGCGVERGVLFFDLFSLLLLLGVNWPLEETNKSRETI